MSAVGRAVKRRQKRDFMIAMTKFYGLFGVLEIYVSWVWDGIVKFIYWSSSSSSSLPIKDEIICFRLLPLADISILAPAKCYLPFFAYNHWTFLFFVYLIFVQFISSRFSSVICFGTSVNCTLGFLFCILNVISFPLSNRLILDLFNDSASSSCIVECWDKSGKNMDRSDHGASESTHSASVRNWGNQRTQSRIECGKSRRQWSNNQKAVAFGHDKQPTGNVKHNDHDDE